jgi:hypothetical protein
VTKKAVACKKRALENTIIAERFEKASPSNDEESRRRRRPGQQM